MFTNYPLRKLDEERGVQTGTMTIREEEAKIIIIVDGTKMGMIEVDVLRIITIEDDVMMKRTTEEGVRMMRGNDMESMRGESLVLMTMIAGMTAIHGSSTFKNILPLLLWDTQLLINQLCIIMQVTPPFQQCMPTLQQQQQHP